jgi:hypothetical protein
MRRNATDPSKRIRGHFPNETAAIKTRDTKAGNATRLCITIATESALASTVTLLTQKLTDPIQVLSPQEMRWPPQTNASQASQHKIA